jgi:hypothetical protein
MIQATLISSAIVSIRRAMVNAAIRMLRKH